MTHSIFSALTSFQKVIERVVDSLQHSPASDQARQVDIFLGQLGRTHQTMGVDGAFLDCMGPIFCQSIRGFLQERQAWDQEVRIYERMLLGCLPLMMLS